MKPRITWHAPPGLLGRIAAQQGLWRCSAPSTSYGWGNTPKEAYEHWEMWKNYEVVRNKYSGVLPTYNGYSPSVLDMIQKQEREGGGA